MSLLSNLYVLLVTSLDPYFAIDIRQREYLFFTEADYHRCEAGKITICPANSIYFQSSTNNRLCRRKLLFDYRTPTLQKRGTIWLYYLPEPRQVTIRCLKNNTWTTRTELLHDAGLLFTWCFSVFHRNTRGSNPAKTTKNSTSEFGDFTHIHTW